MGDGVDGMGGELGWMAVVTEDIPARECTEIFASGSAIFVCCCCYCCCCDVHNLLFY